MILADFVSCLACHEGGLLVLVNAADMNIFCFVCKAA